MLTLSHELYCKIAQIAEVGVIILTHNTDVFFALG